MKLKGHLGFNVILEADIPETGMGAALSVLKPQAILDMARAKIAPVLHNALQTAFLTLRAVGIQIKVLESRVDLREED